MKKFFSIIILMLTLCVATADAQEKGIASYYGLKAHGRRTYNGEKHDAYGYVCAHKKHPMGTSDQPAERKERHSESERPRAVPQGMDCRSLMEGSQGPGHTVARHSTSSGRGGEGRSKGREENRLTSRTNRHASGHLSESKIAYITQ